MYYVDVRLVDWLMIITTISLYDCDISNMHTNN
jgi:hypothetical protein